MKLTANGMSQLASSKLLWGLVCVVGFSVALPIQPALAQVTGSPQGTITTQGHGEVKVRPDSLSVNVTVESKNATLVNARTENNRKMQAIIAALKGLNIADMKLETQGVNVFPIHGEYQRDKLPKIVGYQVTNSLNVIVTKATPDTLGEFGSRIVDTALNAGANNVSGLNFYLSDMTEPRARALKLAVQDARNNANAMAQAADVTVTGVYSMEGFPQYSTYPRPMPMYSMKAEAASAPDMAQTPVETGETTVTSDVTVRYKF